MTTDCQLPAIVKRKKQMQVSAEIRWFWPDQPPEGLQDWFVDSYEGGCAAGGGLDSPRLDIYLLDPGQTELGLKVRNAGVGNQGVEVKGLVENVWGTVSIDPFTGPIQLWTKWSSKPLQISAAHSIGIKKQRWLRKFDTGSGQPTEIPLNGAEKPIDGFYPASGCNVELTRITLPTQEIWWTLGFEAFGSTIVGLGDSVSATAGVLAGRGAPSIENGKILSYPEWLNGLGK